MNFFRIYKEYVYLRRYVREEQQHDRGEVFKIIAKVFNIFSSCESLRKIYFIKYRRLIDNQRVFPISLERKPFESREVPLSIIVDREQAISIIGIVEETPSAAKGPANWLRERRHHCLSREESTSTSVFSRAFSRNYLTSRQYILTYYHKGSSRLRNRKYL